MEAVQKENLEIDRLENFPVTFFAVVMGMLGLKARFWPNDRVLVCQRKTMGFYTDPRPLEVTPLYPEGNGPNGGPTESHRSDATMKRGMGIDQPLAACWITGVVTP